MKAKGGTAKMGDVIPYIFCQAEGEVSAKSAQADRAKHPDEVRRSNLQVGMLHLQINDESMMDEILQTMSTIYLNRSYLLLNDCVNQ
jgi:hypothetical protein